MIVEFECEDSADKLVVWRFKMKAFSGPRFPSLQCIAYPRREIPMTLICVNRENTIRGGGSTGQLVQLFSDVKIQDLKVSLELRILYILYNILYICNLKNS